MKSPVLHLNNKQPTKTLKNSNKSKNAVDLDLTDEEDDMFSASIASENDIGYIRQTFNFTKGDYFDDFSSR